MTFPPANFDPSIDPTADQVRALRDAGPNGLERITLKGRPTHPARVRRPTAGTRLHSWKPWAT